MHFSLKMVSPLYNTVYRHLDDSVLSNVSCSFSVHANQGGLSSLNNQTDNNAASFSIQNRRFWLDMTCLHSRPPSWIAAILDWETEKAWDEYNRATQGVGLRRIWESGEGPPPPPSSFFASPNPLSKHEP